MVLYLGASMSELMRESLQYVRDILTGAVCSEIVSHTPVGDPPFGVSRPHIKYIATCNHKSGIKCFK